jgi:GNAT superfamily N-acetyltransferase
MAQITVDEIRGPESERQFAALEDQGFAVSPPGRYLDDFPIWDSAQTSPVGTLFRFGAFDDGKLVAAAGVRLANIQCPKPPLTAALIGAVATAPDYRGRGLATQLVSLAVQWAGERGAAFAMLWGSEHQLYSKIGFAPCGTQATLPLSTLVGGAATERKISTGWTPGLMGALKSRRSGVLIRDIDRGWLQAHKNVKWYWTGSPQQVTAYAALGRGIDLPHFVHEWGGERGALLSILKTIASEDPEAKLLGSPAEFGHLGLQHDQTSEERLGLARLIDATSIFKCIHPQTPFTAGYMNGEWKLSLVDSLGKTASASLAPLEASQLFFGPLPTGIRKPWSDYFPLPLWFWGLDAV